MLQKTTDEALRVEDDLAEAIDLIWMLDAAVRGFDFDPDTPNGRAAAGMASTFELVVEKLKGCGQGRDLFPGFEKISPRYYRRAVAFNCWPICANAF